MELQLVSNATRGGRVRDAGDELDRTSWPELEQMLLNTDPLIYYLTSGPKGKCKVPLLLFIKLSNSRIK